MTDLAQKEFKELLERNNVEIAFKLDFPVYKIYPDDLELALKVLENHKMRVTIEFQDKQPQKE